MGGRIVTEGQILAPGTSKVTHIKYPSLIFLSLVSSMDLFPSNPQRGQRRNGYLLGCCEL